jgi:hypothetical protein
MTDYSLLKEFLESDTTQTELAKKKGMTTSQMNKKLWHQLNMLYMKGLHSPGPYAYEVRYAKKNKEVLLSVLRELSQNNE